MKYWKVIGNYDGEAGTFEALAGALQASPYNPDEDATLIGIRLIIGGEAASSLVNNLMIRLTCTQFQPNTIHVAGAGCGLRTAPAFPAPVYDFEVNQKVKSGVGITMEGKHATGSPVTCNAIVLGMFDNGK
jgi:hypothetical protein